jgi:hypothetical protein
MGQIIDPTHGEEYMQEAVYFKTNEEGDLYMVAQISQEDFVTGQQIMFQTLENKITVPVR